MIKAWCSNDKSIINRNRMSNKKLSYRTEIKSGETCRKMRTSPDIYRANLARRKNATFESINKIAVGLSISLSELFEKIDDCNYSDKCNYPALAYDIIQSVPNAMQEKLVKILKLVVSTR